MAPLCANGSSRNLTSRFRCAVASDCSGAWTFGFGSRGQKLPPPIPTNAQNSSDLVPRIKKLRALARNPNVDLWAMDEVHFQQHGSRCRMWIPPEVKDPICLHHPTRKSVGFFGAVRLRDGRLITRRESGRFDGETC